MEDEQVHHVYAKLSQAGVHLRGNRLVEFIDLVDHKHALSPASQGGTYNRLAVTILVTGSRVDEIEPKVHGSTNGGHALLQWDGAVSQVADPQHRCVEAGGA